MNQDQTPQLFGPKSNFPPTPTYECYSFDETISICDELMEEFVGWIEGFKTPNEDFAEYFGRQQVDRHEKVDLDVFHRYINIFTHLERIYLLCKLPVGA